MKGLIGFYDYTVILTYLSLFSAVIGMDQAWRGEFTHAIICLFLCGFCDAFDGTVARTKKGRTDDEKTFGIQLDSLCDVIAFGVFPAFLCHFMGDGERSYPIEQECDYYFDRFASPSFEISERDGL